MKKDILLYSIFIFIISNYFYPYTIELNKILAGFPFKWLTIYDLTKNNLFYLTTNINIGILIINITIIYLLLSLFLHFIKKINDTKN